MRKAMLALVCTLVLLAAAAVLSQDAASLLQQVDQLWTQRNGSLDSGKKMHELSKQAFEMQASYDAAWRAARSCFWVCDRSEDKEVDKEWGQRGEDWGNKAIALNAGGVEGYYYKCISLGEKGKGIGIPRALMQGVGKKYEESCNKAISINGNFDRGGPYRAMGRYYQSLPWPQYDAKKAEDYYLKSKPIPRTLCYLLELYINEEQWDKAKQTYDKLVALTPDPNHKWEDQYYIDQGKALGPQIKK